MGGSSYRLHINKLQFLYCCSCQKLSQDIRSMNVVCKRLLLKSEQVQIIISNQTMLFYFCVHDVMSAVERGGHV